ncbi:MAG: ABC transporter substrate-binding protein [Fuerstiella sp.]
MNIDSSKSLMIARQGQLLISALRRSRNLNGLVLCSLLLLTGCSSDTDDRTAGGIGETKVTLALNWYAEAEHGGYVLAAEDGLYSAKGLDVVIQQGGPGAAKVVIQELAAGRIEFAVSNADLVVLGRAEGVPLVAVAAALQQSPRCIMVHQASGINRLQDLKNVELAISDRRPFALWMKKKLPLSNVVMVPYNGQVREFLIKPNFAQQAYVFSEPFQAKEGGGDPVSLMLSDIGYNPYGSVLVTTEAMIQKQPLVVRAMVEASVKGWGLYLESASSTNSAIHRDNPEMSLASLEYGAAAMKPLCQPSDQTGLCGMTEERWQHLIDLIVEVDEISLNSVAASDCFDLQFLNPAEPSSAEDAFE